MSQLRVASYKILNQQKHNLTQNISDLVERKGLCWNLSEVDDGFHASVKNASVDDVVITDSRCGACMGTRQRDEMNRSSDMVGLVFAQEGTEILRNGDHEVVLKPGTVLAWSSEAEIDFRVKSPLHKISIIVPRRNFNFSLDRKGRFSSSQLPAGNPLSPILMAQSRAFSQSIDRFSRNYFRVALSNLLELSEAAFLQDRYENNAAERCLLGRIKSFIHENLKETWLSPRQIAKHNGISVSQLHRLFAADGLSVSRHVLAQRLERCKKLLENPAYQSSMTELAHDWGFSDSAHFSRSFKDRFGVSPAKYRKEFLR